MNCRILIGAQEMTAGGKSAWSRRAIGAPPDGGMQGNARVREPRSVRVLPSARGGRYGANARLPCGRSLPAIRESGPPGFAVPGPDGLAGWVTLNHETDRWLPRRSAYA